MPSYGAVGDAADRVAPIAGLHLLPGLGVSWATRPSSKSVGTAFVLATAAVSVAGKTGPPAHAEIRAPAASLLPGALPIAPWTGRRPGPLPDGRRGRTR